MKRLFKHGFLLTALLLGIAYTLTAQSTLMTIYMNDGTEQSYYMAESDRVYFEDNEKLVVEIAVTAKSNKYNLAEIRKIICSEVEGLDEGSEVSISLSPNPVHEAFILRNLDGRQYISIYALDGRLMKSIETVSDQPIDISDLPIGLYLVKTDLCTLKMIKL